MATEAAPATRGTKRKRDNDSVAKPETPRQVRRRLFEKKPVDPIERATSRLRGAQVTVLKAAKAAKLFETQRVLKKLKNARHGTHSTLKNDELAKQLETALEVIKNADPHVLGNEALENRLRKDGVLSKDETLMTALSAVIPPVKDGRPKEARMGWNRLLSNKKLSQATVHIIQSLKKNFGRKQGKEPEKEGDEETEETTKEGKPGRKEKKEKKEKKTKSTKPVQQAEEEGEEGEDETDEDEEMVESALRDTKDDSEDDTESESEAAEDGGLPDGGSDAPVDDIDDEVSGEDDQTESTFLPALNAGFIAGSDSEYDDDAEDVDGPERKNRRGQRARKAIWEKKYGKNANHIKKLREESTTRGRGAIRGGGKFASRGRGSDRGRGASRGSGSFNARGRGGSFGQQRDSGWGGRVGRGDHGAHDAPPAQAEPPRKPADDKALHPSWQAKINEKASGQLVAPQGKKIVFS